MYNLLSIMLLVCLKVRMTIWNWINSWCATVGVLFPGKVISSSLGFSAFLR